MLVRKTLAAVFGLPETDVRVLVPYLGGGFGAGLRVWPHVILAALAARVIGRPVKLVLTRPQMFTSVGHRPRDTAARAARRRPRWPAGRGRSRVHRDDRGPGRRRRRARPADHRQRLRLPERRDTRPAGAAAHPEPALDAGPGRGPGELRDGVRARRAVLHTGHRPDRAAAAELHRGSPGVGPAVVEQGTAGVLPRRRRAIRLGQAHPRDRVDARRELAGRLRDGRSHVHAGPGTLPGHGVDPPRRHRARAQRGHRPRYRHLHDRDAGHGRVARAGHRPGKRRDRRQRPAVRAVLRRLGNGDVAERRHPRRRGQAGAGVPGRRRRRRVVAAAGQARR